MTLFKRLRRRKLQASTQPLVLLSEQAPCTCPEPCDRDHGNE